VNPGRLQCGFIMLPVVVALTLLATIVYLISRDAGMGASLAGRGLDADSARYVAEAGLARMNYRAQTANCTGYGSLNSVAFGSDSFSASSSPSSGSPVTLTATGATAGGATVTLTRSNVTVRQTTPTVMVLQPGPSGTDTYVQSDQTTTNYGAQNEIQISNSGPARRALLRFDLSSIPAGAYVQSAQLGLYANNSNGSASDSLIVYRVTRAWTEGTGASGSGATWNRADGSVNWTSGGGDYDSATGIATVLPGVSGWNSFDATQHVVEWVAGTQPNHGMLVAGGSGVNNGKFASGDESNASVWPRLTVTFFPPCGWTPPQTVVTLNPTADGQVNASSPDTSYGGSTLMLAYEAASRRSLVRFNTSGISAGTALVSAKLRLHIPSIGARSGSSMTLLFRALTQSWSESSFTWNRRTSSSFWTTPGGDFAGSEAATLNLPSSFNSGWIEVDITALAQAWVDGVTVNNGVIYGHLLSDQINVDTKEGAAATRPQLVITY
jgi:hypothetical protein